MVNYDMKSRIGLTSGSRRLRRGETLAQKIGACFLFVTLFTLLMTV